jgi:hypothetical protein
MTEPNRADVQAELRRALGHEPDAAIVDYLEEQGWLGDVADDVAAGVELPEAIDSLVAHYHSAAAFRSGRSRAGRPRRVATGLADRSEVRGLALSRIFAIDAARDARVEAFRRRWLHGSALSPAQVEPWLHARRPTRKKPRGPAGTSGRRGPRSVSVELLSYLLPGSPSSHAMVIPARGPLQELKWLAEALSRRYGWAPAEATTFVLTDQVPRLPLARASIVYRSPWTAASTIELEISPRMKPAEVAGLYRRVRAQALGAGQRRKDLQATDRAELAVFAFEHAGDAPWRAVMELWNAANIGRAYTDVRAFTRDCLQAFRGVTGMDLDARRSE